MKIDPKQMSPGELLTAHRALRREAFSLHYSIKRILRAGFNLRWGAFLMCAVMNSFYCLKALTGNLPRDYAEYLNDACYQHGAPPELATALVS